MKTASRSVFVTKLSGEREPWDVRKLRQSLKRAGAQPETVATVVEEVERGMRDGMSTSEIYRQAFSLLHAMERKPVAARYSLRRAVMALGPSGFPFEKFFAEILKVKGFRTSTGVMLKGACAEHEIDVLAENGQRLVIVEAKFHNDLAMKSDLKVALYVRARLDDLAKTRFAGMKTDGLAEEGWLVTNTKFTAAAASYAACAGLTLIGWNYPEEGNLQDLIEETKLHPLTCLTTLSGSEKMRLMGEGHVLCRSVSDTALLRAMGLSERKISSITEEVNMLCPIE